MIVTNKLGLPDAFVDAATRDHKYTPKRYSVTSILKGTREAILQRRHSDEIETDVADCVWLVFGSAVHKILEQAQEGDTELKEEYVTADFPNGYTLSGIFDSYNDSTGTVVDWKTASVWKVIYDEWDDYKKQLLCYCWILRGMGFNAHRGEIVAMLKDHSKTKAKRESNYPKHPVYIKSFEFSDADFDNLEEWLFAKFREIEEAEKLPDDELPLCTPDERWAKPDTWAVKKIGNKRALKVHNSLENAEKHLEQLGDKYEIEYRQGKDGKCSEYCSCCEFCSYWKEKYGEVE